MSKSVPAVKAMTLLNSTQMDAAIKSITTRGAKLQADIHTCAVSALAHFAQHGDSTLLNRLIVALPKSARTNALVAWALHFGQLVQNDDKSTRVAQPVVKSSVPKAFDLEACQVTPFWAFKAQEGTPTWSFDTYSASLIKSLDTAISKATDDAHKAKLQGAKLALAGGAVFPPAAVMAAEMVA